MVRALNAPIIVAGIVLIIVAVASSGVALIVVGDLLVVGGVLMYWAMKQSAAPIPDLGTEQAMEREVPGQRVEEELIPTAIENGPGGQRPEDNP